MGKERISKRIKKAAEELERYYSQFPAWYWKYGLHDAKILSISELELPRDWKEKHPRHNCLEICLDGHGAMYEQDICKICLYNYTWNTPAFTMDDTLKLWWIGDTLQTLGDRKFHLEITLQDPHEDEYILNVDFEEVEVERK